MFSMYAAKWLVAAGFAMLVAWLCLLSRSHGIHPIRRLLDLPGIRSKVGIAEYDCLATTCDVSNDTAYASLALNGTNIWTGSAVHERWSEIGNWTSYTANELNQYVGTAHDPLDGAADEYSLDGEMLANGYFKYAYDAKSRLVSVGEWKYDYDDPALGGNDNPHWYFEIVVSNVYDHLDRRVQKITPEATHSFFYDGWMLVKEVIASANGTTTIVEYHWGNDLSGSRGGAAGVGGLLYLSVSNSNSQPQLFIPWYDSNGNIMGYWDDHGKVAASFDYGAFGETSACGDDPAAFPIRFSTKYHDVESGLYYYTKRFYIPSLHRWLTRDPIEEDGGVNLYEMCGNNTLKGLDALGQVSVNPMWRSLRPNESERVSRLVDEIAVKTEGFLRSISYFRTYSFPQARQGSGVWFVPKEIDRTADLAKLPHPLVLHFDLEGHKNNGSLNMALTQIENRLKKEILIRNYKKFKMSNCLNVFCATGYIDALTTPFFIGFCHKRFRDMTDSELRVLIGHEASHKFHSTQDYYYEIDEKKLYDAYSWGLIYE